jgi:hypothetical protein
MPLLDLNDIDESTQEYIDKTRTVEEKGQDTIDKIEEKVLNRNTGTFMHHLGVLKTFLLSRSLFYTGCSLFSACALAYVSKDTQVAQHLISWITDLSSTRQPPLPSGSETKEIVHTMKSGAAAFSALYYFDKVYIVAREALVKVFGDYR